MSELSSIWHREDTLFNFNPPSIILHLLRYNLLYNSKVLFCLLFQSTVDWDFQNCVFTFLTTNLKPFMMVMTFITCFTIKAPL